MRIGLYSLAKIPDGAKSIQEIIDRSERDEGVIT
jgi:hypothetical protein